MPDVFLSYSREDQPVARRFAEALGREGFSVWWDQTLSAGEAYDKVTETALRDARAVVVLWSREMSNFRRDTRFQKFTSGLGMMAYWQKYGPPDDCTLVDGKLACR